MNRNTAAGLRVACSQVLSEEGNREDADIADPKSWASHALARPLVQPSSFQILSRCDVRSSNGLATDVWTAWGIEGSVSPCRIRAAGGSTSSKWGLPGHGKRHSPSLCLPCFYSRSE
jgi:hypothetical protein